MQASMEDIKKSFEACVTINGNDYYVPQHFSRTSLNEYLRTYLKLTGTKVMCREGGCGVCIVDASFPDPNGSGKRIRRSINSCLVPILSCDGWKITTVEGIGSQRQPHPLQTTLTSHCGTQCGYCTPGWIMTAYSNFKDFKGHKSFRGYKTEDFKGHQSEIFTKKYVENVLDGNICRCTGYRPIADAFKSLIETDNSDVILDIEDLDIKGHESSNYFRQIRNFPHFLRKFSPPWHKAANLAELYHLKRKLRGTNSYFVLGHTGVGVFNESPYGAYVDMRQIRELFFVNFENESFSVGAGMSLTDLISAFKIQAKTPSFSYLQKLAELIGKTGHTALRNVASWGGNMALKNRFNDFPSDTFVCMAVSDVKIIIGPDNAAYSAKDFLKINLQEKIILQAVFKTFDQNFVFRTFKIMPRSVNAHAYVIAGFRAKVDRTQFSKCILSDTPSLVFGNISPFFVNAEKTEKFLRNKDLADETVLQTALTILYDEIKPWDSPAESSAIYRKSLSVALFYKFALEIIGNLADVRFRSAVGSLVRPVSSGEQFYSTIKENFPLTKPIRKIESLLQCSGEAQFISDIDEEGFLYAAFVLSTEGNAAIGRMDTTDALNFPGVVRVITAAEIPGENNVAPHPRPPEQLLATDRVSFCGQPLAIVIAVSQTVAEEGAKKVRVEYTDIRPVILTCHDAIREKSFFEPKFPDTIVGNAEDAIASAPNRISGKVEMGGQHHFHMETQVSVVFPTEDGLNIEAGTQWIDHVQDVVSQCVGIKKNQINVTVRRLGGSFGGKIIGNSVVSAAAAVAAYLLRRPVKMHLSLQDNLIMMGGRFPYVTFYEAGFDNHGRLLGIKMDIYANVGASNTSVFWMMGHFLDGAYKCPSWKISFNACKTNLPANAFCRSPASTEATFFIETILENISHVIKISPPEIKRLNFYQSGDLTIDKSPLENSLTEKIMNQLLENCQYSNRQTRIEIFNRENRWRKRGLAIVPQRYGVGWKMFNYTCLVVIYHNGGTVAVTHGGIEMGQGINTKVAQVVAHELGIEMDRVQIKPTSALTSANSFATGGSVTSELACLAAIKCCAELKEKIAKVQMKMKISEKFTWEILIEHCYQMGVDLSARSWIAPAPDAASVYSTYGAMCTEVEIDVLTGEYQINRLDVLYDCGESISPMIDIGQIEGAVVMGLGYFTTEELLYDKTTGANLTFGTWKYKPPMLKDIPVDFRVSLLQNVPNPNGVLRSKLVAEPPLCMTCSVVFALKQAIRSYRLDSGTAADEWMETVAPMTVERVQQYCNVNLSDLSYHA